MRSLSILIYHRVLARPDPLLPDLPDVRQFDRHMALLKRCFQVLPLDVAVQHLRNATLPARSACITFDDGYADNVEWALPVLRRHQLHATFFIASGYLNGGQMWNDDVIAGVRAAESDILDLEFAGCGRLPVSTLQQRRQAISHILARLKYLPSAQRQALAQQMAPTRQQELMMCTRQLLALRDAGMGIGAHTSSHPILAVTEDDDARADIISGRRTLEALTAMPVALFAYPNGKPRTDYDQRHVAMLRQMGFEAAVSTEPGAATAGCDLLQLPRYTPWERDRPRFLIRLLQNASKASQHQRLV